MKHLIFFVFAFIPMILSAQTVDFSIEGVGNPGNAKYAYLYMSKDRLEKTEFKEGRFKIEGKINLNGQFYRTGLLFLDERNDISFEEVESKLKEHVWLPGRDQFIKSIVLEEIKIEITEPDKLSDVNFTKGVLTQKMVESRIAAKEGNPINFIRKYPDSPVGLYTVSSLVPFYELPGGKARERWGSISEMYDQLSERLKNSEQGVALKKKIDQLDNRRE